VKRIRFWMAFLVLVFATATGGLRSAGADEDFMAAREAFRAGDVRKLEVLARRLQGHVLEPYVAYWQLLRGRLEDASAEQINGFAARFPDSPLGPRLHADWLKVLGRAQRWDLFESERARVNNPDLELTCYGLQARLRSGGTAVLHEGRALWFVARELPESCVPVMRALIAAQQLSIDDLWTRIRIGLEAGRVSAAVRIAALLPAGQGPDSGVLNAIYANPGNHVERLSAAPGNRAARESAMFAVYRLARTSPQQAATHWSRLESRFSEQERAYVWGQIAYFGALRHDASALAWFDRAGDLSDMQLAWKVRAALRARQWPVVLAAIDAMTSNEREDGSWRYWRARALRAMGNDADAVELLKRLSHEHSFYGQLATEDLGRSVTIPPSFKAGAEDIRAVSQLPGIRRALALYRLGLRVDGNREWLWAIREADDRRLLAAAEVARREQIYDRAINTADRTAMIHDFSLRYPAPFRDTLRPQALQLDLDEAWIYGLIRQESRFITGARSSAGAGGLMQLMPATAKWVAGKLGLKDWRWSQVTDVDTNISLGTYYLRHVLDVLDGQPVLASAAYNAGPGRARAWRPDTVMEGAVYAETIPFSETRDYVKKVLSNATYYAHTLNQDARALKDRLGVLPGRQRNQERGLGDTP